MSLLLLRVHVHMRKKHQRHVPICLVGLFVVVVVVVAAGEHGPDRSRGTGG